MYKKIILFLALILVVLALSGCTDKMENPALLDLVLVIEKALWFLTVISILLNIAPIILELKNKE